MAEFAKYRDITAKLKKRFFGKPNYRDASSEFKKLAGELEADFKEYAGYCMLSAAQCEHNIVGSLREQQLSSAGTPFSSSSSSSSATNPRPGSAVASNLLLGTGSVGLDRVVQTATLTEYTTLMETARLFKEAGNLNAAISAFAHGAQICPEKMLPLLYADWADMYRKEKRYFEAADIYLEGGLLREAIDCLLTGQHFEDAYHCYQELFKLASKEPTDAPGITRSVSSTSTKSPAITRMMMPFFGRQKSAEPSSKSKSNSDRATAAPGALHQPPAKSDGGPFADTDHLTIDDYITTFLLRLYLYDPVKYEYPCPIIPLPPSLVQCNLQMNFVHRKHGDEEEDAEERVNLPADQLDQTISTSSSSASGTGGTIRASADFTLTESFLPFVDFLNCRKTERTVAQLIELNMLLETLYLSYRNELRHTIDHDYANGEDSSWSDSSSTEDSDSDLDEYHDAPLQPTLSSPAPKTSDSSEVAVGHGLLPARRDSVDDDPPTTTTTTTTNATSTSSAFEKNDLDDISLKLEQLALQYGGLTRSRKSSKNRSAKGQQQLPDAIDSAANGDFSDLERKFAFQQRIRATEGDNDQQLRLQIAIELFPLLNGHQNQLVYLILQNKD